MATRDFWQSSATNFENQVPVSNSGEVGREQKRQPTSQPTSEIESQQGIQEKLATEGQNFSNFDSEKMKFHERGSQLLPEPSHSNKVEVGCLLREVGRSQLPSQLLPQGDQLLPQG